MVIKRGLWSACLCSPILGESKEGFLDLEPSTNRFCALLLKLYILMKIVCTVSLNMYWFLCLFFFFSRQLYLGMKRQTNEIECDKQIAQLYWILFSAGWSVRLGYMIPENGNMLVRESDWHGLGVSRVLSSQVALAALCVWVLSCFSLVRFFAIPWTVVHQAPLSMGFPRQE